MKAPTMVPRIIMSVMAIAREIPIPFGRSSTIMVVVFLADFLL